MALEDNIIALHYVDLATYHFILTDLVALWAAEQDSIIECKLAH